MNGAAQPLLSDTFLLLLLPLRWDIASGACIFIRFYCIAIAAGEKKKKERNISRNQNGKKINIRNCARIIAVYITVVTVVSAH